MNFQNLLIQIRESVSLSQLISAVNVLLIGSAAWIAGDFGAAVVEEEFLQVPRQEARFVPPKATVKDRARRFSEFKGIIENNVFDVEVKKEEIKPVIIEEVIEEVNPGEVLQQIINNLELKGIHYLKGYYIYCIIYSKKKRTEEIYTIGEEIFESGAFVKRIFTTFGNQRIHIQMGNEVGILSSPGEEAPKKVATAKKAKPKPVPRKTTTARKPSKNSEYSKDGKNFYISATEVDTHLNNFGSLLNQARMVPYFKSGKHQGFKVKAIDKGSLYEKLGLINNDIIKAVNGDSLAEAGGEKLMELFKLLRNEREFTVEIERGGSPQVLSYYVN